MEPALDGARAHAELVGDVVVAVALVGQSDNVESVAKLGVGGGAEVVLQPLQPLSLGFIQVNANHRSGCVSVPWRGPPYSTGPDNLTGCMYQSAQIGQNLF